MRKKITLFLFMLLSSVMSIAQEKDHVDMADTMRSNGKIYVVVAVILTIFTGLIIYLIRLDRKMSRLEKDIHSKI
jgi:hypothetical protein